MAGSTSTFDSMLGELAKRHKAEIDAAVNALSLENQALRAQLAELQARVDELPKVPSTMPVRPSKGQRPVMVSECSDEPASHMSAPRNSVEKKGSPAIGVMQKKMDEINKNQSTKLIRRLQRLLCEDGFQGDARSQPLQPEKVLEALKKKGAQGYTLESTREILIELQEVAANIFAQERNASRKSSKQSSESAGKACISLEDLVTIFLMHDIEEAIGEHIVHRLAKLKSVLVAEDLVETIERLSALPDLQAQSGADNSLAERLRKLNMLEQEHVREMPDQLADVLNSVVGFCVLASIVLVGVSLDNEPDHPMWLWVEGFFAAVFIVEVVLKLYYYGWRQYLAGPDYGFNWLDLFVTVFATADLLLSMLVHVNEASAFKATMVLKSLRLFRFARLMKLFNNSPMLKQLAVMMSGFWIGAPSLMWILVIIMMFIYIVAVGFRSFFVVKNSYHELTPGELIDRCGHGDYVERNLHGTPTDPACILHLIYGDEFFGTVPRSMVTVFRFMIGDTSTSGGLSLVQALDTTHQELNNDSANIAIPFYFFYIPFMIIVIFGIFNIITAIFVETTINGLKLSDTQVRRKRYYESQYVQRKLEELVQHIRGMKFETQSGDSLDSLADMEIDQTTFHELMKNQSVKTILCDLDVIVDETTCHFDLFDLEGIGQITLPHFLGTLLRLRGEPHKIDLVSSWSSVRTLQKNFHEFQQVVLSSLQELTAQRANTPAAGSALSTAGGEPVKESDSDQRDSKQLNASCRAIEARL